MWRHALHKQDSASLARLLRPGARRSGEERKVDLATVGVFSHAVQATQSEEEGTADGSGQVFPGAGAITARRRARAGTLRRGQQSARAIWWTLFDGLSKIGAGNHP